MWLCPSLLQTIKYNINNTVFIWKKKSTGAEFRDLYAIPLSSFLSHLLSYNVCISWIECLNP